MRELVERLGDEDMLARCDIVATAVMFAAAVEIERLRGIVYGQTLHDAHTEGVAEERARCRTIVESLDDPDWNEAIRLALEAIAGGGDDA